MAKTGVIYGINGPVVSLLGDSGFQMNEMVHVGQEKLVGEVIGLNSEKTTIQAVSYTHLTETADSGAAGYTSDCGYPCFHVG